MNGFILTATGSVTADQIDINGHLNVVHYMAIFDRGSDTLVSKIGINPKSIAEGEPTLVAGRILIAHRKELLINDPWELWSAFVTIKPNYLTLVHKLVCQNVTRAKCDIRAAVFCPKTRQGSMLTTSVLDQAREYLNDGMADIFEEKHL